MLKAGEAIRECERQGVKEWEGVCDAGGKRTQSINLKAMPNLTNTIPRFFLC